MVLKNRKHNDGLTHKEAMNRLNAFDAIKSVINCDDMCADAIATAIATIVNSVCAADEEA